MANSSKRHGLNALKRVVSAKGIAGLDARTTAVRAVNEWRTALVNDLGGQTAISTQKAALIDVAARTMLYLNHLDAFLMSCDSLVNKRRKMVLPVLRERQILVDSLARLLGQLGLQRQARPIAPLPQHVVQPHNWEEQEEEEPAKDAKVPEDANETPR